MIIGKVEKAVSINRRLVFARFLKQNMHNRLEAIRVYTSEIEQKYAQDKGKLLSEYKEAINGLNPDDIDEIELEFSDEHYYLEEFHIALYRKATVVVIASFFESMMNSICDIAMKVHDLETRVSETSGDRGIKRARKYLAQNSDINFVPMTREWDKLVKLSELRNCIVHADGDVARMNNKSREKIKKIVASLGTVDIHRERQLSILEQYIEDTVDTIGRFLDYVFVGVFNI